MSHTPGPWVFDVVGVGGSHDNPVDVYEVNNGPTRIAENMNESDARLVASAPELLEALRNLLAATEKHVFGDECKRERAAALQAIIDAEGMK